METVTAEDLEEIGRSLYAKQGYFTIGSSLKLEIGYKIPPGQFRYDPDFIRECRWVVKSTATEREYVSESNILGGTAERYGYYYKIEAMD